MRVTRTMHRVLGDWGTSRLRLFLAAGASIQEHCEGPGIGALSEPPATTLHSALAPWRERHDIRHVILCGMAGSRNGLLEVPYLEAPAAAQDWKHQQRHLNSNGLDIAIAPGLCVVDESGSADVMRGEECQIFGAIQRKPDLRVGRHLVVLPGTHCKWVHLEDGIILGFTTYITGELFALLRHHSTLLRAGDSQDPGDGGFVAGLRRSQTCASGLAAAVFEARTAQLIQGRSQAWAADFLSGLLIGAEVHAALEHAPGPHDLRDRSITLIGDPSLTALYHRALAHYDAEAVECDGNDCAVAGLLFLAGIADPERDG